MKKIVVVLAFVLTWTTGLPCSCKFGGNFLKMSKQADVIVVVEMKGLSDFYNTEKTLPIKVEQAETITFTVIKTLKGHEERKEIKVFADDGTLCRPGIRQFEKGKQYVISLFRCNGYERSSGTVETSDSYYISDCGEHWINYLPEDKLVNGIIDKKRKPTTMTLQKLEAMVSKP